MPTIFSDENDHIDIRFSSNIIDCLCLPRRQGMANADDRHIIKFENGIYWHVFIGMAVHSTSFSARVHTATICHSIIFKWISVSLSRWSTNADHTPKR
jgi:hypothetical protein